MFLGIVPGCPLGVRSIALGRKTILLYSKSTLTIIQNIIRQHTSPLDKHLTNETYSLSPTKLDKNVSLLSSVDQAAGDKSLIAGDSFWLAELPIWSLSFL